MHLNPLAVDVLRELRDHRHPGGWLTSIDIADALGVEIYRVRAELAVLRRHRLVTGGETLASAGYWAITEAGIVELCARNQLKLV